MEPKDDIRPKGTVEVECYHPGCDWCFWVDCLDPRLPDGPFFCEEHENWDPFAASDEEIHACLRAVGLDPDEIGRKGAELAMRLIRERKEREKG